MTVKTTCSLALRSPPRKQGVVPGHSSLGSGSSGRVPGLTPSLSRPSLNALSSFSSSGNDPYTLEASIQCVIWLSC